MALSLHSSAMLVYSSAALTSGSPVSQTSAPCRRSRCAPNITCSQQDSAGEASASRRAVFLGAGAASLSMLASLPSADAADIPIFGIKKKAEQAIQAVENAVEGAVEGAASEAESLVSGGVSLPSVSISAPIQAAIVAGAEVVAVGVVAALVGGVTSRS